MEPLPPEPLNSELLLLENQLRSFVPHASQSSPAQLLYQAGWEAALAQRSESVPASAAVPIQITRQSSTNHYWAAACAVLVLLSTTLGWQVWQQPQFGTVRPTTTNAPATPGETLVPVSDQTLASADPTLETGDSATSALASYLELRERVTRGGLSMWSVSTPAPNEPGDAASQPTRDWQAELLREVL